MHNICVICAIPQETGHLLAKFPQRVCGSLAGFRSWAITSASRSITIIESGIGRENAAKAASAAILHNKPDCLISSGFCGAVTADLQVGDIVTADAIHRLSRGNPGQTIALGTTLNDSLLTGWVTADFISVDNICSKSEILTSLPPMTTAVIEMESFAVASICIEHGVPFIAVRAVSDALDTDPSQLFRAIADQNFNIRLPAVILAVITKPYFLHQLFTLAKGARIAGKSLATAIFTVVEKL